QPDVEQDQIDLRGAQDVEGGRTVGDVDDLVVVVEDQPERLPQTGLVVDDEDDGAERPGAVPGVERPHLRCHAGRTLASWRSRDGRLLILCRSSGRLRPG